jgi:hypothetical protein
VGFRAGMRAGTPLHSRRALQRGNRRQCNQQHDQCRLRRTPEKIEELVRSRTKNLSDLSESQRETNALLKEKLDLTQGQVKSALEILGEKNVPPERLAAKLVEIAGRFKELKTAAAAQPGDDSKIAALKAKAQKAIHDGELGKADEILAAIEKIQTGALDRLALNTAQTTAQRGDVALARLRYVDAAQRFAEAAAKVPQGQEDKRWEYLNEEADALYKAMNSATTPRRCRRSSAIAI